MKIASPVHLVVFTIIGVLFIVFGFSDNGYLNKASILFGGLYIGNVLTEALNYNEEE
jgi:hypothetical protein